MEVLKLILKKGDSLVGRFLIYQALDCDFRLLSLKKNPSCPLCGDEPTIAELADCYANVPLSCPV